MITPAFLLLDSKRALVLRRMLNRKLGSNGADDCLLNFILKSLDEIRRTGLVIDFPGGWFEILSRQFALRSLR